MVLLRISIFMLIFINLLPNYVGVDAAKQKKNKNDFFVNGILVPVFAPFENKTTKACEVNKTTKACEVSKINPSVIKDYAKVLAQANITGVVVNGVSGEGGSLTLSECRTLLQVWVREAKPLGLKVLAQVGLRTSPEIFALTAFAEKLGVDAIVVVAPIIYKPQSAQELVSLIKVVANCAKNTALFYFNTVLIQVNVNLYQFVPLASAQVPTFQGVITNLESSLELRAAFAIKEPQYLIINKHISAQATFALGFRATISAAYNLAPDLAVKIQNAKNSATAAALQEKLNKIVFSIATPSRYMAAFKVAFSIIYCIELGEARLPINGTTYEERKRISDALAKQGIALKCPVE